MEPFGSVTHDSPDLTQPAPSPPRTPASSFTTVTDYSPLNTFQQGSAAKPYQNLRQFDLNEHVATHGGDSLPSSQSSGSGTVATGNDKRNTKRPIQTPIGAFRCQHEGCAYSASSNKDLKRHLQSRKHRNATDNATDESATTETYRCLAPGCKFAEEGCYRLDNLMRHIKTVHYRRGSPPVEDPEGKSVVVTYS
ncbi:hypothetical protein B0T19DRAFT_285224 [Cercophora scortea]|uniref:C2H2-type domain-containing protein n=1 Tax=Cercophora scortea TaxID=314031 RepID=A0AAE0I860_9PEZI|nr:hypothetical protein B0T19DRAFT_285224 [Cercophora scortea]